ncbi:endonuclease/exonuclease/phosphatase family protein [Oceanobacillus sp. 1P07AA]|uniref:endonuclease/exonuclease/phosphatase family protein n=1 Tax=Oceanobacillus sp. 1P07AA TaxID=3132293 RepID=UPI0039A75DAD
MKTFRWLSTVILVSFFVVVGFPVESVYSSPMEKIDLKVGTFNVAAGTGLDGEYDVDRLADTINELDVDIIGLQEVDVHWGYRSNFDHMMEELASRLEMEYYFAPIYDLEPVNQGEPNRKYGVGVLSKYPIVEAENRNITRLSTQVPNPAPTLEPGFLQAKINVEGAEVMFYVTHLDYRGDPTIREMQVADMQGIMSEGNYNILVGDMNARPNATEISPLFSDFIDAWDLNDTDGETFPAHNPDRRIDYIFASKRMEVHTSEVKKGGQASDHLPVIAEIEVVSGNHSTSFEGLEWLIDYYERQDAFHDQRIHLALSGQIKVLKHYQKTDNVEKLLRHLEQLENTIHQLGGEGLIEEEAVVEINEDINYLYNIVE